MAFSAYCTWPVWPSSPPTRMTGLTAPVSFPWQMWKRRSDPVLHIDLRRWADLMLVAPLDANTLGKVASGICDNLLVSASSVLPRQPCPQFAELQISLDQSVCSCGVQVCGAAPCPCPGLMDRLAPPVLSVWECPPLSCRGQPGAQPQPPALPPSSRRLPSARTPMDFPSFTASPSVLPPPKNLETHMKPPMRVSASSCGSHAHFSRVISAPKRNPNQLSHLSEEAWRERGANQVRSDCQPGWLIPETSGELLP